MCSSFSCLLPVMCPNRDDVPEGWRPCLCLSVRQRNPAPGNFTMSFCFGRFSSSSSPVTLWSYQTSCSRPPSLSNLIGLMWAETRSGRSGEVSCSHPSISPHGAISAVTPPAPSSSSPSLRWQEVWKHSGLFVVTRRHLQQEPVLVCLLHVLLRPRPHLQLSTDVKTCQRNHFWKEKKF